MFGLSFTHLILLAVIALVVLGPEQLPEVARTIARLLNEWRRATSDIQSSLVQTFKEDTYRNPEPPPSPDPVTGEHTSHQTTDEVFDPPPTPLDEDHAETSAEDSTPKDPEKKS
jgi:sec-independent protein translocase protein TatB